MWVDNIMMDLGEVGWYNVGWISLAQDSDKLRALGERGSKTFQFHKMLGKYRVASQPVASGVVLRSIVSWLISQSRSHAIGNYTNLFLMGFNYLKWSSHR
jgi:hypothetical protein